MGCHRQRARLEQAELAGAFIGWQYYNKSQEAKETKAERLGMCAGEAA